MAPPVISPPDKPICAKRSVKQSNLSRQQHKFRRKESPKKHIIRFPLKQFILSNNFFIYNYII